MTVTSVFYAAKPISRPNEISRLFIKVVSEFTRKVAGSVLTQQPEEIHCGRGLQNDGEGKW